MFTLLDVIRELRPGVTGDSLVNIYPWHGLKPVTEGDLYDGYVQVMRSYSPEQSFELIKYLHKAIAIDEKHHLLGVLCLGLSNPNFSQDQRKRISGWLEKLLKSIRSRYPDLPSDLTAESLGVYQMIFHFHKSLGYLDADDLGKAIAHLNAASEMRIFDRKIFKDPVLNKILLNALFPSAVEVMKQILGFNERLSELQKLIANKEAQIRYLDKTMGEMHTARKQREKKQAPPEELTRMANDIQTMQAELSRITLEYQQMQDELAKRRSEVWQAEQDYEDLVRKEEQLKGQIEQAVASLAEPTAQIESKQAELAKLEEQRKSISREIERLRTEQQAMAINKSSTFKPVTASLSGDVPKFLQKTKREA